eukprot:5086070-Amphidinium_carterae.1
MCTCGSRTAANKSAKVPSDRSCCSCAAFSDCLAQFTPRKQCKQDQTNAMKDTYRYRTIGIASFRKKSAGESPQDEQCNVCGNSKKTAL